ncbi:MAG: hypothetical protein OXG11_14625, partial [Chloroflexi bacterium]|nr:hypothetical protein [Chloroflexota bacterium]
LTSRIATMRAKWQPSTVLLGTRPQRLPPGLAEAKIDPLTHEDAEGLIRTIDARSPHLDWLREEIAEVLCRPLLAIQFALNQRNGRGVGMDEAQLIASVGEQALEDLDATADGLSELLVQLACRIVDSGGRSVDPRELDASPAQIVQLSRLRIVQQLEGRLSFQLAALTEYLAADALRRDPKTLERSVSSPLRAHRWRYVFVQALQQGSAEQIDAVMSTLLTHAPATASWVQNEAYTPGYFGESTPPITNAEEAGARVRRAAAAWLTPWPGLVERCGEDGELPPLGVALTNSWLKTAWLFGTDATPEPVALIPSDQMEYGKALRYGRSNSPLAGITQRGLTTGQDWPWVWVRDEFEGIIEDHLRSRRLLTDVELCWPELAWDFAHQMLSEHAATQSRPVSRAELEAVVSSHRPPRSSGTFALGFSSDWSIDDGEAFVADLARVGLEEVTSPWPPADLSGGSVEACWTTGQLLLRLRAATAAALDIYRAIVDRHLPSMAPELQTYQLLPGLVTGSLMPIGVDSRYPDAPYFSWHIEPLPRGSVNGAEWSLMESDSWTTEDEWASREARMRQLRGDLVERASFWEYGTRPAIFSSMPASTLALELLWNDLAEFGWVSGPFDHGTLVPSFRPHYT